MGKGGAMLWSLLLTLLMNVQNTFSAPPRSDLSFLFIAGAKDVRFKEHSEFEVSRNLKVQNIDLDEANPEHLVITLEPHSLGGASGYKENPESQAALVKVKLTFSSRAEAESRKSLYVNSDVNISFVGEEGHLAGKFLSKVRILPGIDDLVNAQRGTHISKSVVDMGFVPGYPADTERLKNYHQIVTGIYKKLEEEKNQYFNAYQKNSRSFSYHRQLERAERRFAKLKFGDPELTTWKIKAEALKELIAETNFLNSKDPGRSSACNVALSRDFLSSGVMVGGRNENLPRKFNFFTPIAEFIQNKQDSRTFLRQQHINDISKFSALSHSIDLPPSKSVYQDGPMQKESNFSGNIRSFRRNTSRVSSKFAALGEMKEIKDLIWSGVVPHRLTQVEAQEFCKTLSPTSRLPTHKEYETLAELDGKGTLLGYQQSLMKDTGTLFFWSGTSSTKSPGSQGILFNNASGETVDYIANLRRCERCVC